MLAAPIPQKMLPVHPEKSHILPTLLVHLLGKEVIGYCLRYSVEVHSQI